MGLTIFAGRANLPLAEAVAANLQTGLGRREIAHFPDGELHVEILESVRGDDVYVIQPTSPPVADSLLELLLVADAGRRAGAAQLTAVVPYFGYARQDRRRSGREPVSARLVADLIQRSGFARVITVDAHTPALEGFFEIPLEHLTAVPILARAAQSQLPPDGVIVGPDLGATKLADRYAQLLGLPVAIVHKTRVTGGLVSVSGVTGEVRGRAPIVVDDMITTGGTIEAAIRTVLSAGGRPEITVIATHGLFVGTALERLSALPIRQIVVSDSVVVPAERPVPVRVASLGPLLAEAIRRLHQNRSLSDLIAHG